VSDPINPDYYKRQGCREAIEIIEELGWDQFYYLATAFKYMYRAGFKGPAAPDIRKAIWYLNRYLGAPELTHPRWSGRGVCGCGHAGIVRDGSAPWAVRCSKCNSVRMLPPPA
jgi:hypothetical protein